MSKSDFKCRKGHAITRNKTHIVGSRILCPVCTSNVVVPPPPAAAVVASIPMAIVASAAPSAPGAPSAPYSPYSAPASSAAAVQAGRAELCGSCHRENPAGSQFCCFCGGTVATQSSSPQPMACPVCRKPSGNPTAQFCPFCASPMQRPAEGRFASGANQLQHYPAPQLAPGGGLSVYDDLPPAYSENANFK